MNSSVSVVNKLVYPSIFEDFLMCFVYCVVKDIVQSVRISSLTVVVAFSCNRVRTTLTSMHANVPFRRILIQFLAPL